MEIYHQYIEPGTYNPTLEVMDEQGLTGSYSHEIQISPYTNPTGFIIDGRDNKMYSTVKIGSDWWMSENLDWRPDTKKQELNMIQKCYDEIDANCDKYGSLYLSPYVKYYTDNGENVCPSGWHVPSKDEMDDLISQLPENESRKALEPNGKLDFNFLHAGTGKYAFHYSKFDPDVVVDTVWEFDKMGLEAYALSTAKRSYSFVYTLQITKLSEDAGGWWYDGDYNYYSMRCVKD